MSQVVLVVSHDTEHPFPPAIPDHIIPKEVYALLSQEERRAAWGTFIRQGYCSLPDRTASRRELEMIRALDDKFASHRATFTSFVLGSWLDGVVETLGQEFVRTCYRRSATVVGSHSYHHRTFGGPQDTLRNAMSPNVPVEEVPEQICRASAAIEKHLGVRPTTLRTPMGNTASLDDPRIVKALNDNGITCVSSWLKAGMAKPNMPSGAQPHSYTNLGFPGVWELPGHGQYDVHHFFGPSAFIMHGSEKSMPSPDEMADYYIWVIEDALRHAEHADRPIFVCLVFHPWATVLYDPDLKMHEAILYFCKHNDVSVCSCEQARAMFKNW